MDQQCKRRDPFVFLRYTMCVAGMYPLSYNHAKLPTCLAHILKFLDWLYQIFCILVLLHIAVLYICTVYINQQGGDLEFIVGCLIQTIIYIWAIIMLLYFRQIRPQRVLEIMEFISSKYQIRSALGFTYITMEGAHKNANIWIKFYAYCCYIGTMFWLILPIAYGDHSLPLACWYPFDFKQPYIYELVFFFQAAGQIQVAAAFASSSGFHMVLGILLSGQYDMLFCSLKNVIASTYIEMGANRKALSDLQEQQSVSDAELNQYSFSVEEHSSIQHLLQMERPNPMRDFRIAFKMCFKRCLKHHRYILAALQKMEDFYSPIWLFKICEVTILLCLVCFVSIKSTAANSLMRIVSLGQYLFLVMYELFIICYFSDILYQNSQRCGDALWRSPWHLHIQEIRSDYLFFLLNGKRKFQLTGGKIFYLNVERFRGTITTAFSFLTLLQKMDARH